MLNFRNVSIGEEVRNRISGEGNTCRNSGDDTIMQRRSLDTGHQKHEHAGSHNHE